MLIRRPSHEAVQGRMKTAFKTPLLCGLLASAFWYCATGCGSRISMNTGNLPQDWKTLPENENPNKNPNDDSSGRSPNDRPAKDFIKKSQSSPNASSADSASSAGGDSSTVSRDDFTRIEVVSEDPATDSPPHEAEPMELPNSIAGAFLTCWKSTSEALSILSLGVSNNIGTYGCSLRDASGKKTYPQLPLESWSAVLSNHNSNPNAPSNPGKGARNPPEFKVSKNTDWHVEFTIDNNANFDWIVRVSLPQSMQSAHYDLNKVQAFMHPVSVNYGVIGDDLYGGFASCDFPCNFTSQEFRSRVKIGPNLTFSVTVEESDSQLVLYYDRICGFKSEKTWPEVVVQEDVSGPATSQGPIKLLSQVTPVNFEKKGNYKLIIKPGYLRASDSDTFAIRDLRIYPVKGALKVKRIP